MNTVLQMWMAVVLIGVIIQKNFDLITVSLAVKDAENVGAHNNPFSNFDITEN
jgi:hypothetical protein